MFDVAGRTQVVDDIPSGPSSRSSTSVCTGTPATRSITRPTRPQPRFEYSNRSPGVQVNDPPAAINASMPAGGRSRCRSAHASSDGSPDSIETR